ncbi:putative oxidoreductase [Agrobacterium rubi TR3 = NBRC 13261]|uniref:Putative oxidoreductase n=1 Tax=Agrobacterium rubi TR3 = NBRC 13261 TaxID=1368415 RepID=A0A081CWM5_9HYPH|nr:FAD-dependent monooxygenase [Agrobacterium rubi]MBP1878033.1 salicylate hydroxylase [Agrobacterium rubi]GAK71071.1 putative oxidoreductase [Agrobacterium rubi TR3 = NBRC 13261]
MPVTSVAIIGAGIAGLTAALSFARYGVRCDIIERSPQLEEVGAGLQISPNAARILAALDVLPQIEQSWLEPETVDLASGLSLKRLVSLPMRQVARSRWEAPYGVLHRATLQQALLAAVQQNPLCTLHLGIQLDAVNKAEIAARISQDHDLIVGADGVWSSARHAMPGSPEASFSGYVAWRFTVAKGDIPDFLKSQSVTAFLGPSAHLVAYPLAEMGAFNVVAIAAGANPGATWQAQAQGNQQTLLMKQFSRWNSAFMPMIESASKPTFWPLFQAGKGVWHNGTDTVLIGDAAHAMMPFAAQGAAMAIEDAFELATFVNRDVTLPEALSQFQAHRIPRIDKARKRAALNKFAYHAAGPLRLGRDMLLSVRPPEAFLADFDWLYGYRAKGL